MTVEQFQRAAIGGRALDAADLCFIGLEQQVERSCQTPSDEASLKDILAHMADVELSLVLLLRLRRAATLIREHVENCQRLEDAIGAFNAAVPDLAHLRNTQEHFDDYILVPCIRNYLQYASPHDRLPKWQHRQAEGGADREKGAVLSVPSPGQ